MTPRARTLIAALIAAALPAAGAAGSEPELLLPPGSGVTARWILPPSAAAGKPGKAVFGVGGGGRIWLGFEGELAAEPAARLLFRTRPAYSGFTVTAGGSPLFCSGGDIRIIPKLGRPELDEGGRPVVPLQPAASLPVEGCRLFNADGKAVYAEGSNPGTGRNEVYLLSPVEGRSGFSREIRKILSTEREISAVAGDGRRTFVAIGRLVMEVDAEGGAAGIFLHPEEEIKALAFSGEGRLFFATAGAVGLLAEKGPLEFLRISGGSIIIRNGALYVLGTRDLGVLKVEGIEKLGRL